jgi:hypothetical protein
MKDEGISRDREFAKPHFGPEETAEVIERVKEEEDRKKDFMRTNLKMQIEAREIASESSKRVERQIDRAHLSEIAHTQMVERAAMQSKNIACQ